MPDKLTKDYNRLYLDYVRRHASIDYQSRIPDVNKANMAQIGTKIMNYEPAYNEFLDTLVNVIAEQKVRGVIWNNPLKEFKRGELAIGGTISEIYVDIIDGQPWKQDVDYESMFARRLPRVEESFYSTNRQQFYPISISDAVVRRAFLKPNGLDSLISAFMSSPLSADEQDEFLSTMNLFREHENEHGFYKIKIPDITSLAAPEANVKAALKAFKAAASTLGFLNRKFNVLKVANHSKISDLHLFLTPEARANIDIEALAYMFHIDKAEIPFRVHEGMQEHFNIPGFQAALVDKNFFVIADTLIRNGKVRNEFGLYENRVFHHHQIFGTSLFANAILFTSNEVTPETNMQRSTVTGLGETLTITDPETGNAVTEVLKGHIYQLSADILVNDPKLLGNHGIIWSMSPSSSNRTYVTEDGVLHVGRNENWADLGVDAKVEDARSISKHYGIKVKQS